MRIFIKEDLDPLPPSFHFDKFFTFCYESADFYPHDFITFEEEKGIYDDTYKQLMTYLGHDAKGLFLYQGVDLLWCFKRDLFVYVYHAALRHELIHRFRRHYKEAKLFAVKKKDRLFPYLYQHAPAYTDICFLEAPLKIIETPRVIDSQVVDSRVVGIKIKNLIQTITPRANGNIRDSEIVFFSDYVKVKHPLQKRSLFYSSEISPSLFLKSLIKGFSNYQGCFNTANKFSYELKKDIFLTKLREFSNLQGNILLSQKIAQLFHSELSKLLWAIDEMHALFSAAPKLQKAYLDEDMSTIHNAFSQVARLYKVESWVQSHGALGHKIGFLPLTSDYIAVWGKAQKDKLISWGCDPANIVITGCQRYEAYKNLDRDKLRKKIRKDLSLKKGTYILFAFMPVKARRNLFEHQFQSIIFNALEVINDFPEQHFIIKVHMGDDNVSRFRSWVKCHRMGHRVSVIEKYDSLYLARGAEVIVTYNTTFAVDGLAMRRPVICLSEPTTTIIEEFRSYEAFTYVDNRESLKAAIETLLTAPPLISATVFQDCLAETV